MTRFPLFPKSVNLCASKCVLTCMGGWCAEAPYGEEPQGHLDTVWSTIGTQMDEKTEGRADRSTVLPADRKVFRSVGKPCAPRDNCAASGSQTVENEIERLIREGFLKLPPSAARSR